MKHISGKECKGLLLTISTLFPCHEVNNEPGTLLGFQSPFPNGDLPSKQCGRCTRAGQGRTWEFSICVRTVQFPRRRGIWHQKSYMTQEANRLWEDFWGAFWPVSGNGCYFFLDVRVGTCSVTPQWENTGCLQGIWGMVIWTVWWGSYSSLLDFTILPFYIAIANLWAEQQLKKKTKADAGNMNMMLYSLRQNWDENICRVLTSSAGFELHWDFTNWPKNSLSSHAQM